jgi:hypothetical protein
MMGLLHDAAWNFSKRKHHERCNDFHYRYDILKDTGASIPPINAFCCLRRLEIIGRNDNTSR